MWYKKTLFLLFMVCPIALAFALAKPLSSEIFSLDSYSDVPIDLLDESTALAESDSNPQSASEPLLFASPGTSAEDESNDLFGTWSDYSSFSSNPDNSVASSSDGLFALLSPNAGNDNPNHLSLQSDLASSHEDSGSDWSPPPPTVAAADPGENLNTNIIEGVDRGVNGVLQYLRPLVNECSLKANGRVPLCCVSKRKALPRAYECTRYDESNLDCKYFNYQFCCVALNPIDAEGIDCTKGFYTADARGGGDEIMATDLALEGGF